MFFTLTRRGLFKQSFLALTGENLKLCSLEITDFGRAINRS